MKRVPVGSFERLSSAAALWAAWTQCRRGKRRHPNVAAFELDADRAIFALHRRLVSGDYKPSPYRLKLVRDPKTRLIASSPIADRVVQTALLNDIGPAYERAFIDQSYACRSGRGPHRAVLAYLQATRRHRYRLSLDIRRYFASIEHARLLGLFARRLHDRDTLALLELLLRAGGQVYRLPLAMQVLALDAAALPEGCGMPLGSTLSHWSGALYLDGLDHYVKRVLKIASYQRYMDDITLFHDDLRVLEAARGAIEAWLIQERGLKLKIAALRPTHEASTYLGFRVSRAGLAPGPKAKRRLKQRLRSAGLAAPAQLARSLHAYRGVLLSI